MDRGTIRRYVENQLAEQASILRSASHDAQGKPYLTRFMFYRLRKLASDFLSATGGDVRWVLIPGLRGVGKTTIVAQLFADIAPRLPPQRMLYVSLDDVVNKLGCTLYDVLDAYEEILGEPFAAMTKPIVLLIDEAHYDPKWQHACKRLYDRTKRAFMVVTGSSALSLRLSADTARRTTIEPMYPLAFTEYAMLASRIVRPTRATVFPPKIGSAIAAALFETPDVLNAYSRLHTILRDVEQYWQQIDRLALVQYLKYYSVPSVLSLSEPQQIISVLNSVLDRIIRRDVPEIGRFDQSTVAQIPGILTMLAGSDVVSFQSIVRAGHAIKVPTVMAIFDVLERAELLLRIYPYGAVSGKVRKPSKYLFMAPSMRVALQAAVDARGVEDAAFIGKLLEDGVGATLRRRITRGMTTVSYDAAEGGADFVLELPNRKVAVEVGWKKPDAQQVHKTMKRGGINEGILITDADLAYDREQHILTLPLRYFFLM